MNDLPLTGKTALVTGAGRMMGTGHSIAVRLARAGCHVAINGRGSDPAAWPESERRAGWRGLESVAEEIRSLGVETLVVQADIGDSRQVDAMIESVVDALGGIDILVNNAAAPKGADRTDVVTLDDAVWHNILDVKINGSFYCSRAAARQMLRQGGGGRIVNISSASGKAPRARMAAYSVANSGMQMLGACLARELGGHGITVNSLCVGFIDTSRNADLGRGDSLNTFLRDNVPVGRLGTPSEVADFVAFLCSDEAAFITGQSINVDGGLLSQ